METLRIFQSQSININKVVWIDSLIRTASGLSCSAQRGSQKDRKQRFRHICGMRNIPKLCDRTSNEDRTTLIYHVRKAILKEMTERKSRLTSAKDFAVVEN